MLLLWVLEKIEQLPIEGKVDEKHLCSYNPDHLIYSDSFCLPEDDAGQTVCSCWLCGSSPGRAHGDCLEVPGKGPHFLLQEDIPQRSGAPQAASPLWKEQKEEQVPQPLSHWASFRACKTAPGPVMILGMAMLPSEELATCLGSRIGIWNQWTILLCLNWSQVNCQHLAHT